MRGEKIWYKRSLLECERKALPPLGSGLYNSQRTLEREEAGEGPSLSMQTVTFKENHKAV